MCSGQPCPPLAESYKGERVCVRVCVSVSVFVWAISFVLRLRSRTGVSVCVCVCVCSSDEDEDKVDEMTKHFLETVKDLYENLVGNRRRVRQGPG